jgi:hypothetical protein
MWYWKKLLLSTMRCSREIIFVKLYIGPNVRIRKESSCDKVYTPTFDFGYFCENFVKEEISPRLENFEAKLYTAGISFIKGILNYRDKKRFVLAELELDLISLPRLWFCSDPAERTGLCTSKGSNRDFLKCFTLNWFSLNFSLKIFFAS